MNIHKPGNLRLNTPDQKHPEVKEVQDTTQQYLTQLKSEIDTANPNEIQSYLNQDHVQNAINEFRNGKFDTLNTAQKRSLLKAAMFYRAKLMQDKQTEGATDAGVFFGAMLDKATFATTASPNSLIESLDNKTVLNKLILPLFGEIKVTTRKGNLLTRDADGDKIGSIPSGASLKLDIKAEPSMMVAETATDAHLYTAVILENGSKAYVCTEFLGTKVSNQKFTKFLKSGQQQAEMQASLDAYKAYTDLESNLATKVSEIQQNNQALKDAGLNNRLQKQTLEALRELVPLRDNIDEGTELGTVEKNRENAAGTIEDKLAYYQRMQTLAKTTQDNLRTYIASNPSAEPVAAKKVRDRREAIKTGRTAVEEATKYRDSLEAHAKDVELDSLDFEDLETTSKVAAKLLLDPAGFNTKVQDEILTGVFEEESTEYKQQFLGLLSKIRPLILKKGHEQLKDIRGKIDSNTNPEHKEFLKTEFKACSKFFRAGLTGTDSAKKAVEASIKQDEEDENNE